MASRDDDDQPRSPLLSISPQLADLPQDFDYAMTLTERSRSPPISLHGSVTQRFWEAASVPSEHDAWKLAHKRVQPAKGFSGYPSVTAGKRSLGISGTWKAKEHSSRALANIMKHHLGTRTWKPTALC
mmetsp:Transcript_11435/g.26126  ORF Transcript_11435/g.26126 Transcript_11435/m.26126 type:complete len:128 (-) Transcript_11435:70-453(-)